MNEFRMSAADPTRLIDHMSFYGLADILQAAGLDVLLRWDGETPVIVGPAITDDKVDEIVAEHIRHRAWIDESHAGRGTMSPRVTTPNTDDEWRHLSDARHEVIDSALVAGDWHDLAFFSALGEPGYWRYDYKGKDRRPDEAATRWDMRARNNGAELVGKLRELRDALKKRAPGSVAETLSGKTVHDDLEKPAALGRTAAGLAAPGPTDGALAWCALWAIKQFPVTHRVSGRTITAGCLELRPKTAFYVPVWDGAIRTARLRTLCRSAQLAESANAYEGTGAKLTTSAAAAVAWLADRKVVGLYRFPVGEFGTDKAAERRALEGIPIPLTQLS